MTGTQALIILFFLSFESEVFYLYKIDTLHKVSIFKYIFITVLKDYLGITYKNFTCAQADSGICPKELFTQVSTDICTKLNHRITYNRIICVNHNTPQSNYEQINYDTTIQQDAMQPLKRM